MDIRSTDFADSFNKKEAHVGVFGMGLVGESIKSYFERHGMDVIPHDPFNGSFKGLDELVKNSQVIFVCTPTPLSEDLKRSCTSVVDALDSIEKKAMELGRPSDSFVVCIMSSVNPGFTKSEKIKRKSMRITVSPEFLSNKNPEKSLQQSNRFIVGGDMDDARVILQFFLEADKRRVEEGKCVLIQCDITAAELTRIFVNSLLMTKNIFSRQMSEVCHAMGVSYEEVRVLTSLDNRVGASFTNIQDSEDREIQEDFSSFGVLEKQIKS